MKRSPSSATSRDVTPDSKEPRTARRRLVVGAGVAAGAALAAAALQRQADTKTPIAAVDSEPAPAQGYRLTEHVRRYYETTRA
ncbi:MAG TPA: formate dehydrogenase [Caldimonas sp.]|jgi:hypothetical protein